MLSHNEFYRCRDSTFFPLDRIYWHFERSALVQSGSCFFLSFMMCILVIQNLCSTFAIVTTVHWPKSNKNIFQNKMIFNYKKLLRSLCFCQFLLKPRINFRKIRMSIIICLRDISGICCTCNFCATERIEPSR